MNKHLNSLKAGERGIVLTISTEHMIKERLESLGIINGIEIEFIRQSPMGSIRIYKCLNNLVAIRDDIAKKIQVEVL